MKKYGAKIESQVKNYNPQENFSKSYRQFKESLTPELTPYEKWAKTLGNVFTMKVSKKDEERIQKSLDWAHLNLTVSEVAVFAITAFLSTFLGGILLAVAIWLLFTDGTLASFPMGFVFLVFLASTFIFYYSYKTPERIALKWRLKASSQMVPAILYIVIYMKHTSNFEKAVAFASEHLQKPLSLDFKKVFWDVEVGRFSTLKDSLDNYLESWRGYSIEFIEAFHLIESSLYETTEERRQLVLERSLQVILDGVYDKMLKYTHNVKSPLTNLYMLGIVLPTLSLAILPLASTMLQGSIKWYHIFVLFNLIIPFAVIYMTGNVMSSRPGGYGEQSLLEQNPLYPKYKSNKYYTKAILLALPLFILGLLPLIWMYTPIPGWLNLQKDYALSQIGLGFLGNGGVFGIIENSAGQLVGPFGVVSLLLSLLIPISIAMVFIMVYKSKTNDLLKIRDEYKGVEREFTSSLFQLGNRMGDGLPAEIAFSKVLQSSKGTSTEGFFKIVNENMHQLGMSLEQSLFNPKRGAVVFYPSQLILTSMKVLVESVRKGLKVAAKSLMSISDYVKNIRKIDARLNDLLADIISDMKSNIVFLAPLLLGIIVGLAGMITSILGSLNSLLETGSQGQGLEALGGVSTFLTIFDVTQMMPPYWLQLSVGLYLIEVVFILTATLITIKSGRDELEKTSETGKNLKRSIVLYSIVAFIAITGLTLLGSLVIGGFT